MSEETTQTPAVEPAETSNSTVQAKLAQTIEQKQHYKEKLEKAQAVNEDLVKEVAELKAKMDNVSLTTAQLELASKYKLEADEIKLLEALAASAGKSPTEMLENETFKTYKEGKSAKSRLERTIPPSSSRVPVVGEKTFSELTHSERKTNYSQTVNSLIDKARVKGRNIT